MLRDWSESKTAMYSTFTRGYKLLTLSFKTKFKDEYICENYNSNFDFCCAFALGKGCLHTKGLWQPNHEALSWGVPRCRRIHNWRVRRYDITTSRKNTGNIWSQRFQ
ncbi:hypothetical protein EB796_005477 [Bugula neritina]|uniref:Uncharacterized protein n=1 Tax=Bugula neritina TaxID=10212 RepID=A0A7J7KE73_BUGNE|nr:hypothetical protein EB796_005477 [Bugula neritina]